MGGGCSALLRLRLFSQAPKCGVCCLLFISEAHSLRTCAICPKSCGSWRRRFGHCDSRGCPVELLTWLGRGRSSAHAMSHQWEQAQKCLRLSCSWFQKQKWTPVQNCSKQPGAASLVSEVVWPQLQRHVCLSLHNTFGERSATKLPDLLHPVCMVRAYQAVSLPWGAQPLACKGRCQEPLPNTKVLIRGRLVSHMSHSYQVCLALPGITPSSRKERLSKSWAEARRNPQKGLCKI